jgi:hypothetical protein
MTDDEFAEWLRQRKPLTPEERERLANYTDEDRRRDIAKLMETPLPPRSDEPEDFEQNGMVLMQRAFMKIRVKMLEREKNMDLIQINLPETR